ncbi:MAG: hypothetical protein J5995_08855 [Muribaculaceae bacterium]|nr:hypothetical protein [Muribaculaceae bacterium]
MAIAAIAAVGCLAGVLGLSTTESNSVSALTLANIEALSTPEYMQLCNLHCKNRNGYICVLYTNQGYNIYCNDMVPWC